MELWNQIILNPYTPPNSELSVFNNYNWKKIQLIPLEHFFKFNSHLSLLRSSETSGSISVYEKTDMSVEWVKRLQTIEPRAKR